MTEIPDLAAFFGMNQPGSPEYQAAAEALHQAGREQTFRAVAQVGFFAAILCDCKRRYDRDDASPSSAGCVVHGQQVIDQDTGALIVYGGDTWQAGHKTG